MLIQKYQKEEEIISTIFLISDQGMLDELPLSSLETEFIRSSYEKSGRSGFGFNRYTHYIWIQICKGVLSYADAEKLRRQGDEAAGFLRKAQQSSVVITSPGCEPDMVIAFAEGLALGSYRFMQYKEKRDEKAKLSRIFIDSEQVSPFMVNRLENLIKASFAVRDMVNEPVNVLDSRAFASKMAEKCREAGATVTIMGKDEIKNRQMEALLTVNKGSKTEPTFTVIEWKPDNAENEQPIVLVGKGLVFDTGGINLKPGAGLDTMKSDMAGGAAVFGTLYALALNKVSRYVIGLIPATDNRPGENAMVPGDIIRMKNGKHVEIVNTDAEGRLILADALLYASGYNPELVIDIATLTGAASVAIGRFGIAGMHQGAVDQMKMLMESSMRVYERIVEFPFWEEYDKEIESHVADIRNLGKGRGAGVITAGKFLAHFISYPWIHLDIASMAFMDSRESYLGKGATAVGMRLLYDFVERR
jgi:leucyl aminopeptidase